MALKAENATIKVKDTSTANIAPANKRTMKAKLLSPLTSGKLPPLKSPKPSTTSKDGRVIFIQHMPSGFFEEELKTFFSQFGVVTKVFVARSKRTSRPRGYGYVEFRYPEVARIAASAVNNYLMFGKILKAKVVSIKFRKELPRNLAKVVGKDAPRKYAKMLSVMVRDANGFVGEPRRQSRRLRQVDKVQKALAELKQAEIELPDMPQCFVEVTRLVPTNTDVKRIIKPVSVKKEEDEQMVDSSDDEDAFVPLKPSDWVVMEPDDEPITDDEGTSASQKLVKVEKSEGLKSKAKKKAEGKVQKKTENKVNVSKKAKKSSR